MKEKLLLIILFVTVFVSCNKEKPKVIAKEKFPVTTIKSVNYNQLKPFLEKQNDTIYVVNFWATWCAPCVKELPYFEKLGAAYSSKKVKVLLVSLDFPKQVEKKLIPFINENKIQSEVILLDDVNEDIWIQAIDKTWSGAIPATLIYHKNQRKFYEQTFDYQLLENELIQFLNP
ncbi:TlpA family protein disulfide reductase [Polaribacter sp.]|uniref:TlpA family protein disulfide reductase n=1 Tax=Polaribacter sp. TaxID=1920175 RepID=UPI004047148F